MTDEEILRILLTRPSKADEIHPIHKNTIRKILEESGFPSAPSSVMEEVTLKINELMKPLRDEIDELQSELEEAWEAQRYD